MYLLVMLVIAGLIIYGLYWLIKQSFKFIFAPFVEDDKIEVIEVDSDTDEKGIPITKEEPQRVILKEANIDTSRIQEYEGEELRKFEFRPQTWKQFISQEEAKLRAKTIMKKAERGIKSHLILSAIKGHGKTTFIELLAKSMNARLIQRVGKQIDEDSLVDILNEINTSPEKHVMLFIDEIDSMDWKVIKVLNPIIEQFKISGKRIKPFIFACATINKHLLVKNNPDTLDRIPHHIQFTRYTAEDIAKILSQYKEQLYPTENVSQEVVTIISQNCKHNPRTSLALLEDFIVEEDIQKVLKNNRIVKGGLTDIDIKILSVLNKATRAMGANAVAMRIGLGQNEYLREYEPFLYEFGYIERTPSRSISEKGRKLLKGLNKKEI